MLRVLDIIRQFDFIYITDSFIIFVSPDWTYRVIDDGIEWTLSLIDSGVDDGLFTLRWKTHAALVLEIVK